MYLKDSIEMADELKAWQAQRNAELLSDDSWLGLIGLYWLQAGRNLVGSSEEAVVKLPEGGGILGEIVWQADGLLWLPVDGAEQTLLTDALGAPTTIEHGNFSFFVVDREGQLAVRVRDRNWRSGQSVVPLRYFEPDPDWCLSADWISISPPLLMEVPNVSGDLKPVEVGYKAVFSVAGQRVELLPMSVGDDEVFFVFRDRTSGKESYGAGRFLKANVNATVHGTILLNFNFAYNPPCAFTAFATCPLPPPENWLPFPVMAGEKKWQGQN
jgi:uncharacterized protein (DUF1684 family)